MAKTLSLAGFAAAGRAADNPLIVPRHAGEAAAARPEPEPSTTS